MEKVNADFARMASETKSQEAEDQKDYDESMSAHDIEKAERTQEVTMKEQEKARRTDNVASLNRQLSNTENELEKTNQYIKDLQPACVDGDSSYSDRKDARAKEITALKKAQQTLLDAFKDTKFLQVR